MATKIVKVIKPVERKTYIKGNFVGKYYGDFDSKKVLFKNERYYNINIYEGEIRNTEIISESDYEDIDSETHFLQQQFENVTSITDEQINNFDGFRLKINAPKVQFIDIEDVVKEDNQTFGTFSCKVYGYLIDTRDKEFETEIKVCDWCYKIPSLCKCKPYRPIEIDKPDTTKPKDSQGRTRIPSGVDFSEIFGWFIIIGLGIAFIAAIGLPGLILLAVITVIYFLFSYVSVLANGIINIIGWLLRLFFNFLIFMFAISILSGIYSVVTKSSTRSTGNIIPDQTEFVKEETTTQTKLTDSVSIISHQRVWRDYNQNIYRGNLSVLSSDFNASFQHRNLTNYRLYDDYQWTQLYHSLINNDKNKLEYVIKTFDSISRKNQLNKTQFAEMVVSCIQDIPYALVLQEQCKSNLYEDNSIKQQLYKCQECCIGDVKYGVQAPVEFVANLKGDCDTRTVLLFTILSKFGYDVAVLGSLPYQHSILAINLPYNGIYKSIKGKRYYTWETTAKGFEPGVLNPEISNMDLWSVHLITNNN